MPEPVAVVLAAGEGTRMASSLPKVLHRIGGQPLIAHVLATVRAAGIGPVAVVVGPDREDVAKAVRESAPKASVFVQKERRGTAHAVLAAKDALKRGDVLVMFGDTPLVQPKTIIALLDALRDAAIAVLGFRPADPKGYGRLVLNGANLEKIVEERDASDAERKIELCNAGLMAFSGEHALKLISRIKSNNAKKEFYLTDAIALARSEGLKVTVREAAEEEVMGINDKSQLAEAEAALQKRLRADAMKAGASFVAPHTVFLSKDTKLGKDVVVEPYVVFGPGVVVEEGATIRSFSHLEGARVGKNASVGPYARLRPGAQLGEDVRIGNFVEVKASTLGKGSKANHLAYVGDATVGKDANIGAGTITCNYDGFDKHKTIIGDGAFIGTNSSLVAPVKIENGGYVASGSVITQNVPADALGVARARQANKKGWAKNYRKLKFKGKAGKRGKD
jgi:bifunctional UDP-N-acetylglucosamine pyrophosphorylase / glucosamine-1-phosphate N-acetyltransferase